MQELGFAVLAILGYPFLVAWLMGLSKVSRIAELEQRIEALNERVHRFTTPPSPVAPAWRPANVVPVAVPLPDLVKAAPQAPAAEDTITSYPPQPETTVPEPEPAIPADINATPISQEEPAPDPYLEPSPRWLVAAKTWLLTGNLVAELGLVILFIGIGFLLKYAAATFTIPIELRLAAVVLADFGLLAWGWRLSLTRRELALPIQGTAIAILMLVIFSAYQLYALLPSGLAFALRAGWPWRPRSQAPRPWELSAHRAGRSRRCSRPAGNNPCWASSCLPARHSRPAACCSARTSGSPIPGIPAVQPHRPFCCGRVSGDSVPCSISPQAGWSTICLRGWAIRMRAGSSCMQPRSRSPRLQACCSAHAWRGHDCAG